MASLISLPAEILHHILQWTLPADLVSLPRVSRAIHSFIQGNQKLHQDVYLNYLDKPQDPEFDWEKQIHDLVRLQVICRRLNPADKKNDLNFVHDTVTRLLHNASSQGYTISNSQTHCASKNVTLLEQCFEDESNRQAFLQRSFLFERVRNEHHGGFLEESSRTEMHQQSAKLHCLYGRPILNVGRLRSDKTYPFACSKVYDLRQYTDLTGWGPFRDDTTGRVDWEKLEAIMVVLGHNINLKKIVAKIFSDVWDTPFAGSWPRSFMPSPGAGELSDLNLKDPYGITGTWYRIVCFLDYNDFWAYNFPLGDLVPPDRPRPGLSVGEATRLIVMRSYVTAIEPPGPEDGQALPVVHFKGTSRSLDESWDGNAHSDLRGTVRLTKEGEVRWTTFSIFHGEERWRSEGIQIGGVRSARGVMGNWFDRDLDPHGPAGPTAFWKATDLEISREAVHDVLPNDFFLAFNAVLDTDGTESDLEGEMDYIIEEEEYDIEDDGFEFAPEAGEVSGLLMDAQVEVADLVHQDPPQ